MIVPMVTLESKDDNIDELPEILEELGINDEKIVFEIMEFLKNHKNCNEIIDILGSLVDMQGVKRTHQNLYSLYMINRDLIWLGSPIYSNPRHYIDDILEFPYKNEKLDVNDIIHEYLESEYMKGTQYDYDLLKPSKKNIEYVLRYLMDNCRIYTFDLGDVYDCPAKKQDEYDDWLGPDHEVEVMRIL